MVTKKNESDGTAKIHNVRFYNLTPRHINCLAFNKLKCKLALSRSDAFIEIWDLSHAPFLEKTIQGGITASVEGIAWVGDRLFSVGLSGELVEWDLTRLKKRRSQLATGNAVWCLDVNKEETFIALGTEEGYVNIFEVINDELNYKTLFDKQEGRILCCKYDVSGEFIVTGSMDVIRIWNVKSGHAIQKMTLGRVEAKKGTIVWSLKVLHDFTIISGDSRGQITVWDGKVGTQIESHQALKADVLAIDVNENEDILVASGVDPIIRIYALTSIKKEDRVVKKWVKFLQRSVHDHDVKAVICAGLKIISGGFDGYLGVSYYSKFHQEITKHGPFLQSPCACVSPGARTILLRYCNYLEVWRLGIAQDKVQLRDDEENDTRKFLSLERGPEKILELKSINDEAITASSLSPDGQWLVYSTINFIRLFSFSQEDPRAQAKLIRITDLPAQFTPSAKVLFSSDSKTLFLIKFTNEVDIFNILPSGDIDRAEGIEASKIIKDVIHLAEISKCGNYLILAGTCRTISIWKKSGKHWKHYLKLPKYLVPTTAMAIHDNSPRLVAAFSDGKIFEYDLEEMRFVCSTSEKFVPNSYSHCVNSIVLDPKNEDIFILHNDMHLFVLQKQEVESSHKSNKVRKHDGYQKVNLKLKFQGVYQHFVHLARLSENELVAVGVNPVALIEQLPGALKQKKFGAS